MFFCCERSRICENLTYKTRGSRGPVLRAVMIFQLGRDRVTRPYGGLLGLLSRLRLFGRAV